MLRATGYRRTLLAFAAAMLGTYGSAGYAVNDEPLNDKWAPSEWGPDDKAGSANRRTAASVLKAIKLQTKRGIWNIENLDLGQLVADKAYEFLFAWSPLKMKGATGSPGNPIAIY
jgi:hypothetical protein